MGTLYRKLGTAAIILVLALVAPLAAAGSAQASSPPTAPSNVKLAPYGALHFYLTWKPGSGQTGFQVTNGVTTENVTSATQDHYLWAVAAPQTYMCFAVRAYNASGYSPWAGMWTCGTTPPGGPPAAPANVTATAYSTSAIKITFTNEADNETAFLFYNGVTTATYDSDSEPPAGATFSVLWGGLAPGTYMCFKVAAYNEWGRSAYVPSSWACATTMSATGTWQKAQEIPGSGSLNDGGAETLSVSCASAGNCGAGGYYQPSAGGTQAFVASESGGSWAGATEVTGAAGSGFNAGTNARVLSVSCPSAGNCAAGGFYTDSNGHGQAFIVNETSGSWGTAKEVPGTAGLNQGYWAQVSSVSCASAGNCTAGGYYTDGTGAANTWAFVASEVSGSWQQAQTVSGLMTIMPGGASQVTSISCPSAGTCTAGGYYTDVNYHRQPFTASEVSGAWQPPQTITGGGGFNVGGDAEVLSVSCVSAGTCAAGGFDWDSSDHQQAFIVSESGGSWAGATDAGTAKLNVTGPAQVSSMSCGSAGNCTAGGYYTDANYHRQPFLINETSGSWGSPQTIGGTGPFDGYDFSEVTSVSCSPGGGCSAGGYYTDGANNPQGFVTDEAAGGTWGTAEQVPGLANLNASSSRIDSVSCTSASSCSAGGYYGDSNFTWQAMVVSKQ